MGISFTELAPESKALIERVLAEVERRDAAE
jgi:hypothetical protein